MQDTYVPDARSRLSLQLNRVRERLAQAAQRSNRDPDGIRLIAVSKTVDPALMIEAIRLGVHTLAENRVQEARDKWPVIEEELHRSGGEFHLVGHLQTNKSRDAVRLFNMIQSVDSERLAKAMDQHAREIGKIQRVLIEVNTSRELTKFGVEPEELADLIRVVRSFKNLKLEGLMTIGPLKGGSGAVRKAFIHLRELRDRAGDAELLPELSMGMSQDYEIAIAEGATMIRVGTAIFGDRD